MKTQEISRKGKIVELFKKKLTIFEISEILNISMEEVKQSILDSGIKLPNRDRKYRLTKTIPLEKEQRELIIGCLLGKGHLLNHQRGKRFTCGHLNEDLDILLWKKTVLGNLVNVVTKHNSKPASFFRSSIMHELNTISDKFYSNNKKVIPEDISNIIAPLSIAAMISDLGWVNKLVNIRLETSKYSYEEQVLLKAAFKSFKINCKICEFKRNDTKHHYISFNKRNSLILFELIKDYYPKELRNSKPPVSQRLHA